MNIICCVKQVPDTETKMQVENDQVSEKGINWIVNPYDEFAVEEALRIKERLKVGKIHVLSVGPARAQEAIKSCLALGCDEATHLSDPAFEGSDSLGIARILAAAIQKIPFDLILSGKQGMDLDCAQVPVLLAEILGIPHATVVTQIDISEDGKNAVVQKEIEGGKAVMDLALPAVITCQKGLNQPRYATLKGIMAVKRKKIDAVGAGPMGIDPSTVGLGGAKAAIRKVAMPPDRQPGRKILGETPGEKAANLVKALREEAKVI